MQHIYVLSKLYVLNYLIRLAGTLPILIILLNGNIQCIVSGVRLPHHLHALTFASKLAFAPVIAPTVYSYTSESTYQRRTRKTSIPTTQTCTTKLFQSNRVKPDDTGSSGTRRASASGPKPISSQDWPNKFPAKEHCSKCGLCETTFVQEVKDSCAFLNEGMQRMDSLEEQIHGRRRTSLASTLTSTSTSTSSPSASHLETRFGVLHKDYPIMLAKGTQSGSQWTGVVTSIAISMLEEGLVDAVVCISSSEDEGEGEGTKDGTADNSGKSTSTRMPKLEPQPILARTTQEILKGRGVKPSLAPSLRVLDEIQQDPTIHKLLFCGVGCAVQAFRSPSVQERLGLEEVYVLGTNCADNSPSVGASREFIKTGLGIGEEELGEVIGYEFMQDFQVHVKKNVNFNVNAEADGIGNGVGNGIGDDFKDGSSTYEKIPYFSLPGTIARSSIADSCLACFDYTNGLADVVVGYMGAPLDSGGGEMDMDKALQTLAVRNERGKKMVEVAQRAGKLNLHGVAEGSGKWENFAVQTVASDGIVAEMIGKQPMEEGMPRFVGKIVAKILTGIGPKGLNFANYSIDYHILRNYLHVLDAWNEERAHVSMPQYAKDIVGAYLDQSKEFRNLKESILMRKAGENK